MQRGAWWDCCTGIYPSIYVTSAKGHIIHPCPLLLLAIRNKCVLEAGECPIQLARPGRLGAIGRCVWIIDGAAYAPVNSDRCALPPPSRSQIHQRLIIMCAFPTRGPNLPAAFTPSVPTAVLHMDFLSFLKWFLIRGARSQSRSGFLRREQLRLFNKSLQILCI